MREREEVQAMPWGVVFGAAYICKTIYTGLMKHILLSALLACASLAQGQTVAIEEAILNKGIVEKRWSPEEMPEIGKKWAQLKARYPAMQFDSVSGETIVEGVITFPGIQKQRAFKRLQEWAAIHFTDADAVKRHEDLEAGKLIFKGYVGVTHLAKVRLLWETELVPTTSNLYFTLTFTVKDERAKVRLDQLRFRNFRRGYSYGSLYAPGEWEETPLQGFFPVVERKSSTWESVYDLLSRCDAELRAQLASMERYVRDVDADYRF